jgi:succinylarginine dihydrolase
MSAREFNFDGLVGPSHNYAGLSFGNVASFSNVKSASNPRWPRCRAWPRCARWPRAASRRRCCRRRTRPNFRLLRRLGFHRQRRRRAGQGRREAPVILACAYSASPMWTANAATVSPSADTADGRVHFTAANLNNKLHRADEHAQSARSLRAMFADSDRFVVHDALPGTPAFGDEGAANHTRLCSAHGAPASRCFVYGRTEFDPSAPAPKKYPARQTLEASQAVARLHGLDAARTVFASQNPDVIDQGVFHNDVIAVGNGNVLFYHEQAFADEAGTLDQLRRALGGVGAELNAMRVDTAMVPVADAVASYLFNSQLLSKDGMARWRWWCRTNAARTPPSRRYLDGLVASGGAIDELIDFDLRQSMRNGGGPACLRLRVALTEAEAAAMHQGVMMTEACTRRWWPGSKNTTATASSRRTWPTRSWRSNAHRAGRLERILGLPGLYDL